MVKDSTYFHVYAISCTFRPSMLDDNFHTLHGDIFLHIAGFDGFPKRKPLYQPFSWWIQIYIFIAKYLWLKKRNNIKDQNVKKCGSCNKGENRNIKLQFRNVGKRCVSSLNSLEKKLSQMHQPRNVLQKLTTSIYCFIQEMSYILTHYLIVLHMATCILQF